MFPHRGNIADLFNSLFPMGLRNTETRYFVLCMHFRSLELFSLPTMTPAKASSIQWTSSPFSPWSCTTAVLIKRPVLDPPTVTLTCPGELVLTLNAFSFNNQFYHQVGGVAMSSKMGPNYACLFAGFIEEQICQQYTGTVPQLHKRYIDGGDRVL